MTQKEIPKAIAILRRQCKRFRYPVVGHYKQNPFETLIACLLSLRTKDETTRAAAQRLFSLARTPQRMLALSAKKIEKAIFPVGFYRTKARTILEICRRLIQDYKGRVPDDLETLLTLKGVGRKTANLVVTLAFGKPGICVDTHVHRIANRWGYVKTKTPDKTEFALRRKLPRRHWIELNDLLVAYGQNLCTPISPFCSRCRISSFCDQVGVTTYR